MKNFKIQLYRAFEKTLINKNMITISATEIQFAVHFR